MNLKRLYFDIETCPCLAWVWGTGKQVVDYKQILDHTKIICISYKWEGKDKVHRISWDTKQDDKALLMKFSSILEQADEAIGHNGQSFDLKTINARLAFHQLPPVSVICLTDTLRQVRQSFRLASYKLDYLARYFKVGNKKATGGADLWLQVWLDNDKKALKLMGEYCDQDVVILEKVHHKILPYVKSRINRAVMNKDALSCPSCGGVLHKHDKRYIGGFKDVQRYLCKACGKVCHDGTNLVHRPSQYPR